MISLGKEVQSNPSCASCKQTGNIIMLSITSYDVEPMFSIKSSILLWMTSATFPSYHWLNRESILGCCPKSRCVWIMGIYTFFCSDFHSSIWCESKEGLEWKNQTLTFSVNCVLSMRIDQKSISYSSAYYHQMHFQIQSWLLDWLGNWLGDRLLWLVIAMNYKVSQFKFQNQRRDAKVMHNQREDSLLFEWSHRISQSHTLWNLKWCIDFWAHSSVSSCHMPFWCPSLTTGLAIHHSIKQRHMIKKSEYIKPTYLTWSIQIIKPLSTLN